jgi:hypothetical protein
MFMYRIVSQIAVDFKKNAVLHTDVVFGTPMLFEFMASVGHDGL